MDTIETTIYNLIQEGTNTKFILINSYDIELLKELAINIRGITYHYYNKWGPDRDKTIIKQYQEHLSQNSDSQIYLLGSGNLFNFEISNYYKDGPIQPNLNIESTFNVLKYLSMYSDQIVILSDNDEERLATNAEFVETLKAQYKTCLFYSPTNTGIVGVEGYLPYHKNFYHFLEDVEAIYIVNSGKKQYGYTIYSEFTRWLKDSPYAGKIKYIDVYVADLYRTNPELIAYYRNPMGREAYNYLNTYYGFEISCSKIDDNIYIGSDSYKYIRYYRDRYQDEDKNKWFPEEKLTHIINVSDEPLQEPYGVPNDSIVYEHYSISEQGNDPNRTRELLFKAAGRLHELLDDEDGSNNRGVYVHCALGVNRSPSVVILYLIKYKNMTLYEAYKYVAKKRRIFTSEELFHIIYEEAKLLGKLDIPICKLRTHYAWNFCEKSAYMFALYDTMHLDEMGEVEKHSKGVIVS